MTHPDVQHVVDAIETVLTVDYGKLQDAIEGALPDFRERLMAQAEEAWYDGKGWELEREVDEKQDEIYELEQLLERAHNALTRKDGEALDESLVQDLKDALT